MILPVICLDSLIFNHEVCPVPESDAELQQLVFTVGLSTFAGIMLATYMVEWTLKKVHQVRAFIKQDRIQAIANKIFHVGNDKNEKHKDSTSHMQEHIGE